jgi:hypothetical protein
MGKRKRKSAYGSDLAVDQRPAKKPYVPANLPEGVYHYPRIEDVPPNLLNYWHQGYSIFERYDEGIWMTPQSWYEVTHEAIAKYVFRALLEVY